MADTDSLLDVIGGVGTGLLLAAVALLVLLGAAGVLASVGLRGCAARAARPPRCARPRARTPPTGRSCAPRSGRARST
ncbi:hypothetical protein ACFQV2_04145 [Actinokineospora soli]|uniref:Uncharacterized protein n=1 Tax=Actinokineospora soli TaxID=1048753 RepID=A0ABW2TIZ8_9PSEU